MKSRICCAFMIAMLLVSTVAFGEIVSDGDWTGDSFGLGYASGWHQWSSTSASAEDEDNLSWAFGEGLKSRYTTVRAQCDWSYWVYVFAEARLILFDGQLCQAYAAADASAETQGTVHQSAHALSAEVNVRDSGYEGDDPNDTDNGGEPGGIYMSNTNWYNPGQGISSEHTAVVVASVLKYSTNQAFCHADARAFCSLVERYVP